MAELMTQLSFRNLHNNFDVYFFYSKNVVHFCLNWLFSTHNRQQKCFPLQMKKRFNRKIPFQNGEYLIKWLCTLTQLDVLSDNFSCSAQCLCSSTQYFSIHMCLNVICVWHGMGVCHSKTFYRFYMIEWRTNESIKWLHVYLKCWEHKRKIGEWYTVLKYFACTGKKQIVIITNN